MDLNKLYSQIKPFYFLICILFITSCGSYQYSGIVNDGIYNSNNQNENSVFQLLGVQNQSQNHIQYD